MEPDALDRAIVAARSIVRSQGLAADHAIVAQNSNKLSLRLLPCDVFARVAPVAHRHATFEVELATQLAAFGSPVAALDPRVTPRRHERDGFEVTLWTHYKAASDELPVTVYAGALERLHGGMRTIDLSTQHFTARVDEADAVVATPARSPALSEVDRAFLAGMLREARRAIADRARDEQPLHGEPHPGNVLHTTTGPRFIDLETCCRGPIEFDLAHVPAAVVDHYPDVDRDLLGHCRRLVLAMVAAWRWESGDEFPDGMVAGRMLLVVLREGPPWPTLDEVMAGLAAQ